MFSHFSSRSPLPRLSNCREQRNNVPVTKALNRDILAAEKERKKRRKEEEEEVICLVSLPMFPTMQLFNVNIEQTNKF